MHQVTKFDPNHQHNALSRSKGLLYGASLWNLPLTICIAEYKDLWTMSIAVLELSSHLMVWIGSHQPTILCSCHTFLGNSYGQVPQLSPARKYHRTYHKMLKANSSKYKDKCQDAHMSTWCACLTCTFLAIRTSIRPSVLWPKDVSFYQTHATTYET